MKNNANRIVALILVIVFTTGCAGRAANPVMVHQIGDENKSCKALERELVFIEEEIGRLMPKTKKTGKNVALGIAGIFLIVPWFFMDLSKAEQIEVNALRQRYNHLVIIAEEKQCGLKKDEIPDFKEKPKKESQENNNS